MICRLVAAVLIACSLGVAIATSACWVHSYRSADFFEWSSNITMSRQTAFSIEIIFGRVIINIDRYEFPNGERDKFIKGVGGATGIHWGGVKYDNWNLEGIDEARSRRSFEWDSDRHGPSGGVHLSGPWYHLVIPCWLPLCASFLIPLMAIFKYCKRRRRQLLGACRICGYDLRGLPACCPECGSPNIVRNRD
jgi:hypothetical protein